MSQKLVLYFCPPLHSPLKTIPTLKYNNLYYPTTQTAATGHLLLSPL